jgi:CUE domain
MLNHDIAGGVFRVLLRMTQYGEANLAESMSTSQYGQTIYENWLFDMPQLLDIASLYGAANPKLTSYILKTVFESQPKYNDDLYNALLLMRKALTEICDKVSSTKKKNQQTTQEAQQTMSYVFEIVYNLFALVQLLPLAIDTCIVSDLELLTTLAKCYEITLPLLARRCGANSVKDEPAARSTQAYVLRLLYHLIDFGVMNGNPDDTNKSTMNVEHLVHCVQDVSSQSTVGDSSSKVHASVLQSTMPGACLRHLVRRFNMADVLHQRFIVHGGLASAQLQRIEFVISLLHEATATHSLHSTSTDEKHQDSAAAASSSVSAEAGLILQMFPDVTIDFANELLEANSNDSQRAISAIVDNTLPSHLAQVDRSKYTKAQAAEELEFQEYLSRTGRVAKSEVNQPKYAAQELLELDREELEAVRASVAHFYDEYEDEVCITVCICVWWRCVYVLVCVGGGGGWSVGKVHRN